MRRLHQAAQHALARVFGLLNAFTPVAPWWQPWPHRAKKYSSQMATEIGGAELPIASTKVFFQILLSHDDDDEDDDDVDELKTPIHFSDAGRPRLPQLPRKTKQNRNWAAFCLSPQRATLESMGNDSTALLLRSSTQFAHSRVRSYEWAKHA